MAISFTPTAASAPIAAQQPAAIAFDPSAPPSVPQAQPTPQAPDLFSKLGGIAQHITDFLGLHGAVDTMGTNVANVAYTKDMQAADQPLTTLEQNVGTGLQLGAMVAPGSTLATAALGGAAAGAGQAMSQNANAGTVAKQGAIGAGIGAAANLAGKAISAAGKSAYKFIIPRSTQEAQMLQTYQANTPFLQRVAQAAGDQAAGPTTAADTAFNNGLVGTESMLGVQAKRASQNLWGNLIQPQLDQSGAKVSMDDFFTAVGDQIVKDNPELNRQQDLLEALNSLSENYKGKQVPLSDLQQFKEGWAKFVPQKVYQGKDIAGAYSEVKNQAADMARQVIYDNLGPQVKQAYIDYGNLKAVQELGVKAMTGGKLKGGFGSFWSAIKDEVLTPIATVAGHVVYQTGKGVQFMGPPGASTVGQLLLNSSPSQPANTQATQQ